MLQEKVLNLSAKCRINQYYAAICSKGTPTYKGLFTLGLLHTHIRTALILLSIIVLCIISIEKDIIDILHV